LYEGDFEAALRASRELERQQVLFRMVPRGRPSGLPGPPGWNEAIASPALSLSLPLPGSGQG